MREFLNLPLDASTNGYKIDEMISIIHWVMFLLAIGWGIFFLITLFKFNSAKSKIANYTGVTSKSSTWLELGMVVFEAILLIGFAIPLWAERVVDFPKKEESTIVRVIGEQFAWNIHYPGKDGIFGKTDIKLISADNPIGIDRSDATAVDDIITNNQLNIPVNKPVIVYLGSKDVIHSFALPVLRAKHDAIPGQFIPLWFQPAKTSAEIQQQTVQTFELSELPKIKNVLLPEVEDFIVSVGGEYKNYILVDNVSKDGADVLYSGMILDKDNVASLTNNSITNVKARRINTALQVLITTEDSKDASGNVLVPSGTALIDDMVTLLLQNKITNVNVRNKSRLDAFIYWEDYSTAGITKGTSVTDANLEQFRASEIKTITIAQASPIEIACAQLCGLGHYRMKGYVNVQTQEEFDIWMKEKEAELTPTE